MCQNVCFLTWEDIFQGSPVEVQASSDGGICCAPTGEWAITGNPCVAMTTPCTYVEMASTKSLSLTAFFFFLLSKSKESLPFRLSHVMMLESGTGCDTFGALAVLALTRYFFVNWIKYNHNQ